MSASTCREQTRIANRWCESSEGRAYRRSKIHPSLFCEQSKRQGFTVNSYRSGELTGARFVTGLEGKFPPGRSGRLLTEKLTASGKTKIRRAIQNSTVDFRCLMTVTFDPSQSELDYSDPARPVISQSWAKEKFKRFINSIKVSCDRRAKVSGDESKRLAYVWVAELQESGNIHFHVLVNQRLPILWLTRLWGQASNSIDVRPVQNQNHAGCYLRKYISKGQAPIEGNRYGISQNLRETMKPMKISVDDKKRTKEIQDIIDALSADITRNGGKVTDYGFFIPPPARSVTYEEGFRPGANKNRKRGRIRKTRAVDGRLAPFIIREVINIIDPIPF